MYLFEYDVLAHIRAVAHVCMDMYMFLWHAHVCMGVHMCVVARGQPQLLLLSFFQSSFGHRIFYGTRIQQEDEAGRLVSHRDRPVLTSPELGVQVSVYTTLPSFFLNIKIWVSGIKLMSLSLPGKQVNCHPKT